MVLLQSLINATSLKCKDWTFLLSYLQLCHAVKLWPYKLFDNVHYWGARVKWNVFPQQGLDF